MSGRMIGWTEALEECYLSWDARTHRNLTWDCLGGQEHSGQKKMVNTEVTRLEPIWPHLQQPVHSEALSLHALQPMEWTQMCVNFQSAVWQVTRLFMKYIRNISEVASRTGHPVMHPGNIVGNGSRVFWKIHHTHKSTNNVELCYSESDPWTGGIFKLQNLTICSKTHWIRLCIWTKSPLYQPLEQSAGWEHLTTSVQMLVASLSSATLRFEWVF